jgi:glycosyltransferase involved in cell wall biosynthesis
MTCVQEFQTVVNTQPLISIGMPVRNEERFLRKALDSLLAQTHANFEIIISDNASSDATPEICRDYARRHPERIRFHGSDVNIGASANFSRVLAEARGKYFMWAAGHDVWEENYLEVCIAALDANADAMIAFGTTRWINEHGEPFGLHTGWTDTRGLSRVGRYFTTFWGNMNPILGLMRTDVIQCQKFNDMVGVDLAILLALAMQGDFVHCTNTCWNRREFRHEANYEQKLQRYRSADYALSRSLISRWFPLARLPLRILQDLWAAEASVGTRLLLTMLLAGALPAKYLTDRNRKKSMQKASAREAM